MEPAITKLLGGGQSWYYLLDSNGKIVMSSHEDDVEKMEEMRSKLHELGDEWDRGRQVSTASQA